MYDNRSTGISAVVAYEDPEQLCDWLEDARTLPEVSRQEEGLGGVSYTDWWS
jgi:hypothetical protein